MLWGADHRWNKDVIERVSVIFSLSKQEIMSPSQQVKRVKARSVLCYLAGMELGMNGTDMGHLLKIGQPAVSRAVGRGEKPVDLMKIYRSNGYAFKQDRT